MQQNQQNNNNGQYPHDDRYYKNPNRQNGLGQNNNYINQNNNRRFDRTKIILISAAVSSFFVVVFIALAVISSLDSAVQTSGNSTQKIEEKTEADDFSLIFPNAVDVPFNEYDTAAFSYSDGFLEYGGDTPTVKGIDVSSYQDDIDWVAVKNSGIDFAMIRVGYRGYTEGGLFLDNKFHQNMTGASEAGVDVGVYFFSSSISNDEALEDAKQVIEWIEPYKEIITYPVAFDWEPHYEENSRTADTSLEVVTEATITFCERIIHEGYKPLVYFNLDMAQTRLDLSAIAMYDFWLVELLGLGDMPTFPYQYTMLQYSWTGNISGVPGEVDLNIGFKDYSKE